MKVLIGVVLGLLASRLYTSERIRSEVMRLLPAVPVTPAMVEQPASAEQAPARRVRRSKAVVATPPTRTARKKRPEPHAGAVPS